MLDAMTTFHLRPCFSSLDREQAFDIRRSVLCGELHLGREAARDDEDERAQLVLAVEGEKPVGTGRLVQRGVFWQVEHLAVLPLQRRRGLGLELLDYFEGLAREAGAVQLVAVAPIAARSFFLAAGFIVEKEDSKVALLRRLL